MKVSAINIYTDWCRIVQEVPDYRLGQHYVNVLGLQSAPSLLGENVEVSRLFNAVQPAFADTLFYKLAEEYQWDVFDLPVYGDYDLTTVRPV